MPRATGPDAQRKALLLLISQWRYLLRNPDFRKDLQRVRGRSSVGLDQWGSETMTRAEVEEVIQAYRREEAARLRATRSQRKKTVPPVDTYESLVKKWRLNWLPGRFFQSEFPDLEPGTVDRYEKVLAEAFKNNSNPDPQRRYYSRPAVLAEDPAITYYDRHETAHPFLRPGQVLRLSVDLNCPQHILEKLISGKLTKAMGQRKQRQRAGFLPPTRERLRVDKADFYIKVYDLVEAGQTFTKLARTLRRPKSTIQSAYFEARKNIVGFAATDKPVRKKAVARASIDPATFTFENHRKHCRECDLANSPEEYCAWVQDYLNQDYVSEHKHVSIDDFPELLAIEPEVPAEPLEE